MSSARADLFRDLGVGAAEVDGYTFYVFLFGWHEGDYFAGITAPLEDRARVAAEMLARVNQVRRRAGLPPLHANHLLDRVSQEHAEDMLAHSYFGHQSSAGLAELAVFVAERVPEEARWRSLLNGFCLAHVTNAQRVATDFDVADVTPPRPGASRNLQSRLPDTAARAGNSSTAAAVAPLRDHLRSPFSLLGSLVLWMTSSFAAPASTT